ncbi:MAG: hypothetical protein ACK4TB_02095 [Gemmobacter sp.]
MADENQKGRFIQLPAKTVEADTVMRRAIRAALAKADAERLKRLFLSDLDRALPSLAALEKAERPVEARLQPRRQA